MTSFRGAAIVLRQLLNGLCLALLSGCAGPLLSDDPSPLSALNAMETTMDGRMKTWCFGRYLVDMPMEARRIGGYNQYLGTRVETERMTREAFRERVEKRIERIRAGYADDAKSRRDHRVLDKRIDVGEDGVILVGHKPVFDDTHYYLDTFKFDKEWVFMTSKPFYSTGGRDTGISDFTKFVQTVRYRPEYEIPRDPGICLVNGFIANDEDMEVTEDASLLFELKDNPDVVINIESSANIRNLQPSLLERVSSGQKLIQRFKGLKTIRSGKRRINGIPGEEWLIQGPSDDETGTAHMFQWEAQGEVDNPDKPFLHFCIESGQGVFGVTGVSTMETPELLKIYEAIVKTIRLRPTGDAAGPTPLDILIIETGE
jgi:hypothetical protein